MTSKLTIILDGGQVGQREVVKLRPILISMVQTSGEGVIEIVATDVTTDQLRRVLNLVDEEEAAYISVAWDRES